MFERFRLFPVLIAVLISFLGMKGLDLWMGVDSNVSGIASAVASEPAHSPQKADPVHSDGADHAKSEQEAAANLEADELGETKYLSAADVDILNSMEERDTRFEAWEDELKIRETMLTVAEKKVEAKIAELRELEGTLKRLVGEQTAREETDLLRLVKVYENMKAKAAAPILERLDAQTQLSIASRMREVKLAAILPFMSKPAAQKLTTQLMYRSEMPAELKAGPAGPEL